jgi:subtilisin family serine protease
MTGRTLVALVLGVVVALCGLASPPPAAAAVPGANEYLVFVKGSASREELAGAIEAAGGTLLRDHSKIGLVIATSDDPGFLQRIRGQRKVMDAVQDVLLVADDALARAGGLAAMAPGDTITFDAGAAGRAVPTERVTVTDPTAAFFYDLLGWNFRAMHAPEAWALGFLGNPTVSVAVLDTGVDYQHLDMAGKVDLTRSASFVPEDDVLVRQHYPGAHLVADLNFHGTLAAGAIACNALGTTCTAPNLTLIGVKVINKDYQGTVGRMVSGILHAADVGADVINISYGFWPYTSIREHNTRLAFNILRAAIQYAEGKGSLVVVEASVNPTMPFTPGFNADRLGARVILPAEAGGLVVSSTNVDDEFGNFNNFGNSLVDISAPGGQFPFVDQTVTAVWGPCSSFTLIEAIDFCVNDPPFWVSVAGTIPATAEVSALAAMIKTVHPTWSNRRIVNQILRTADDLGRRGKDKFFGHGRINLHRAMTQ